MLHTQKELMRSEGKRMAKPHRIRLVRKSMARIKAVLWERALAEEDPYKRSELKSMPDSRDLPELGEVLPHLILVEPVRNVPDVDDLSSLRRFHGFATLQCRPTTRPSCAFPSLFNPVRVALSFHPSSGCLFPSLLLPFCDASDRGGAWKRSAAASPTRGNGERGSIDRLPSLGVHSRLTQGINRRTQGSVDGVGWVHRFGSSHRGMRGLERVGLNRRDGFGSMDAGGWGSVCDRGGSGTTDGNGSISIHFLDDLAWIASESAFPTSKGTLPHVPYHTQAGSPEPPGEKKLPRGGEGGEGWGGGPFPWDRPWV
eukprot:scaffold2846_cov322-Pavlova_lutheri.AAC.34